MGRRGGIAIAVGVILLARALMAQPAPAVDSLDLAGVQQALDRIAAVYQRKGNEVALMANGTLLKYYDRKPVSCGALRITVYDCLKNDWADLPGFRGNYLPPQPDGSQKNAGFSPTEVQEIERRYFDAVTRLNSLLTAVRYESTLKPETDQRARLAALVARHAALLKAQAREEARWRRLRLWLGAAGAAAVLLGVGGWLLRRHFAARAAARAAKRREALEVDDY